jgi:polar amino acid transport system substrate-binding protein
MRVLGGNRTAPPAPFWLLWAEGGVSVRARWIQTASILLGLLCVTAAAADRPITMPLLSVRPYGWLDAQGQPRGLYPDIAVALARESGLDIRVDMVPFARAAALVASGNADATLMFTTEATEKKAVQAVVVFYTDQVVLLRPGVSAASRVDLAPLSLGRMIGGCQELVNDTSANWRFSDVASQESGLRMLLASRLDGFCSASEALTDAVASAGLESSFFTVQRVVLATKPVWLQLSPSLPQDLAERLVKGVRQLQKSGEMARIFRRRLGDNYPLNLPK